MIAVFFWHCRWRWTPRGNHGCGLGTPGFQFRGWTAAGLLVQGRSRPAWLIRRAGGDTNRPPHAQGRDCLRPASVYPGRGATLAFQPMVTCRTLSGLGNGRSLPWPWPPAGCPGGGGVPGLSGGGTGARSPAVDRAVTLPHPSPAPCWAREAPSTRGASACGGGRSLMLIGTKNPGGSSV